MPSQSTRRIPRRRKVALAALAGVALAAAACSSSSGSSTTTAGGGGSATTSNTPVTLRLGYLTNLTHAAPLVGIQDGYFAHSLPTNVTLQPSTYNAGPAEVTALLAGSLDAAYMGPNSAITAYSQGRGAIRIISGATSGGAALVVSPSITSASQLSGKTIATPQLGNTQDVALRTWLRKQGLTFPGPNGGSGQVTILPEDNATTLTSFEAGTIAGAWVPEPWATRLVSEGHGQVLVNEKSLWPKGLFSTTLLVVSKDFLAANPAIVTDLLKGQVATTAFLNSSPTKAQADANTALAAITGKALKASELATAWSDLTFTNDPIASSIATDLVHAKAAGFTTSNISGIYDLGPLNQLLVSQGKAKVATS
ncbi:MAG TPA: ABC transporter substrate-binding protein [Acidimicrobiales bacterium]|nr:ABC transporter substrate-binding protein [Acidimicrobiales bacterium]